MAGTLALVSAAFAAPLPEPVDPIIVPAKSLGGITIGQDGAEGEAAWGDAVECEDSKKLRTCDYGSAKKGEAFILEEKGKVIAAQVVAPYSLKRQRWEFRGALMDFRTDKGNIGLGTKLTTVARRLPQADYVEGRVVTIEGRRGVTMTFGTVDGKNVTQILLVAPGVN